MKSIAAVIGMGVASVLVLFLVFITVRLFVQTRQIPLGMNTMLPSFRPGDKFLIENVSSVVQRPLVRGDVIVFYPPPVATNGQDLSWDLPHILGRLTGFPFLPYETAYVKRVIGLPGERIQIKSGTGVLINGQLLNESAYTTEPANYDLNVLSDIGTHPPNPRDIHPYTSAGDATRPITVPAGQVFVLGDNRNASDDSHIFGMVDVNRVVGRAWLRLSPGLESFAPPKYVLRR